MRTSDGARWIKGEFDFEDQPNIGTPEWKDFCNRRAKVIVKLRAEGETLEAIGIRVDLSRERVRRILKEQESK